MEKIALKYRKTMQCGRARDSGKKQTKVQTIIIVSREKNWIGHVMRGEDLLREVIEARMEGKMSRGRRRMGTLEELYKKESYGIMNRKHKIGYCGNGGCLNLPL